MRALRQSGVPLTPAPLRLIEWIPARAARDEMQHLTDEFLSLVKTNGAQTPELDNLYPYFDPKTPPMPAGRNHLKMDWRGVWAIGGSATSLATLLVYSRWRNRKKA